MRVGAIGRALERLEDHYRLALTLYYFDDLKYNDIAEILDVPLNTVKSYIRRGKERLALLLEELPKAGFTKMAPADGAFYIYADVSDMTDDSEALAKQILEETGIACTPGIDFDTARGRRFLRFSFAGSEETIAEAARRLIAWRAGK